MYRAFCPKIVPRSPQGLPYLGRIIKAVANQRERLGMSLQQHAAILFGRRTKGTKEFERMSTESEQLRKIFVGGLNWDTTEDALHDYFAKWGTIVDCVIMKKDGRSRGFGFVTFDKSKCVDDILKSGEKFELDDREIEPKRSVPRDEASNPSALTKTKKIFVGGLPSTTTEEDIQEYFTSLCEKFGNGHVIDVDLKKDRNNASRLRGFAFVTFDDDDVVEKVCAMRYHEIRMKSCEVKKAESQAAIRKRQEKDDLARGITRDRDRDRDRGDRDRGDRDHGSMGNMSGTVLEFQKIPAAFNNWKPITVPPG